MSTLYKYLCSLVVISFVTAAHVSAETAGDLSLTGRAALTSRDGHNLTLGTEGDDDIVVIQNDTQTFSLDGATGAATFAGASTFTGAQTFTGAATFNSTADFNGATNFDSTTDFNAAANFDSTVALNAATTLGAALTQSTGGITQTPYTVTPAATPALPANAILPGYNVVPTAAANTAGTLPSTPIPGQHFRIFNSNAANAVRVKAGGAATINEVTAGGYISVAAKTTVVCVASSATNYECALQVNPTPAGP